MVAFNLLSPSLTQCKERQPMPIFRIRVTGNADDAEALITALHGMDKIEHIEEIDDLMPHMDDDDSSSAGLTDDLVAGVHTIEIITPGDKETEQVRELADAIGAQRGVPIEYLDDDER
jgi:hypothetical protein